jgi:hypothetical protein
MKRKSLSPYEDVKNYKNPMNKADDFYFAMG